MSHEMIEIKDVPKEAMNQEALKSIFSKVDSVEVCKPEPINIFMFRINKGKDFTYYFNEYQAGKALSFIEQEEKRAKNKSERLAI